jgi:hypothetical protein
MADSASEASAELAKRARELSAAIGDFTTSVNSASGAAGDLSGSLSQLSSGALNFTKQLTSGTDTFGKFSGAINELADGTSDLIFVLGKGNPLMLGLGLFTKLLGAVAGKVFENDDSIIASYDKLASFGAATAYTTDSLQDAGKAAGYAVSNGTLKELTENISKIGTDLVGLAGTASGGVKVFMDVANVGPEVLDKFNKLGISQKKLNEYQAAYVSQQVKTNAIRYMADGELKKRSIEYAQNLVELAAVTGKSTDAIKESQKTDLDDVTYAIHVRKLQQTKEGRDQLAREQKMAERAEQMYGKEGRKGFLKIAATGTIVGEQAIALANGLNQGGVDVTTVVKQVQKGQMSDEKFAKTIQNAQTQQLDKLGNVAMLSDKNSLAGISVTTDSVIGQSKVIKDGTADRVKADIDSAKDRADKSKDTQNDLRKKGKDVSLAMDEFVKLISGPIHAVFKGLLYGLSAFTKGLLNFLDLPGVQRATGIKIDKSITALFMSTEELTARNAEITEQLKDTKKTEKAAAAQAYSSNRPGDTAKNVTASKNNLIEEQKAIQEALKIRKASEAGTTPTSTSGGTPPATTANTSTAPAPAGPSASGQAPPPTATPGSHADGGVARPPFSGFSGALGGTEATIPLPSGENIPAKIKMPSDLTTNRDSLLGSSDTVQGLMAKYTSNLGGGTPAATTSTGASNNSGTNVFELITSRMDDLLEKMTKNNNLQTELLQISKR